ncbi:MAG: hypothetical protein GVY29_00120 [Spirochaetes bacterium]|nr:hypothetical protein [Spirochaetota bacterium]
MIQRVSEFRSTLASPSSDLFYPVHEFFGRGRYEFENSEQGKERRDHRQDSYRSSSSSDTVVLRHL